MSRPISFSRNLNQARFLSDQEMEEDEIALQMHEEQELIYFAENYEYLVVDPKYRENLYKRYVNLDTWLLFSEAIGMVFIFDPNYLDSLASLHIENYGSEILPQVRAAANASFKVLNPDAPEDEWRVKPKEFLLWAEKKGWDIPEELHPILQPKKGNSSYSSHPNAEHHAQRRERVLAAAVAVMASAPEKCKRNGKYSPSAIAAQIELSAEYVYGKYEDSPLSDRQTKDLIAKAIKLIPEK
jgi:hypothetical protein